MPPPPTLRERGEGTALVFSFTPPYTIGHSVDPSTHFMGNRTPFLFFLCFADTPLPSFSSSYERSLQTDHPTHEQVQSRLQRHFSDYRQREWSGASPGNLTHPFPSSLFWGCSTRPQRTKSSKIGSTSATSPPPSMSTCALKECSLTTSSAP